MYVLHAFAVLVGQMTLHTLIECSSFQNFLPTVKILRSIYLHSQTLNIYSYLLLLSVVVVYCCCLQKTPFVIANPAAAMGDTPTAIPHLPPPNLVRTLLVVATVRTRGRKVLFFLFFSLSFFGGRSVWTVYSQGVNSLSIVGRLSTLQR